MLTLSQVSKNQQVLAFLTLSEENLKTSGYTKHDIFHVQLVADRARSISRAIGLSPEEQEMAAISGFCHDMANCLSRRYHHLLGALLFHQIFQSEISSGRVSPYEIGIISQAIAVHDRAELELSHPVSAVLIIADKSDVRRERVYSKDLDLIQQDIHDRVNYATRSSRLRIDTKKKKITLILKIDVNFVPVMEYFEIFTDRMIYCRKAADFLGYKFGIVINNFKLL